MRGKRKVEEGQDRHMSLESGIVSSGACFHAYEVRQTGQDVIWLGRLNCRAADSISLSEKGVYVIEI